MKIKIEKKEFSGEQDTKWLPIFNESHVSIELEILELAEMLDINDKLEVFMADCSMSKDFKVAMRMLLNTLLKKMIDELGEVKGERK